MPTDKSVGFCWQCRVQSVYSLPAGETEGRKCESADSTTQWKPQTALLHCTLPIWYRHSAFFRAKVDLFSQRSVTLLNEEYTTCLSYSMRGKKIKCVYQVQIEAQLAQYPELLILLNEPYNPASGYQKFKIFCSGDDILSTLFGCH